MNLNERFSPKTSVKTLLVGAVAAGAALTVALGSATPAEAAPRTLWVKRGAGCTDTGSGTTAARPFCTITRAAKAAKPGTTVLIKAGRYAALAPRVSGTPAPRSPSRPPSVAWSSPPTTAPSRSTSTRSTTSSSRA
jgi:hypothetical protein